MCMSGLGVCEGQRGGSVRGRGPTSGGLSGSVRSIRGGNEEGGMGGRRRGRSRRAYGVAVTLPPQKGGAVPESEKRRAAWRTTEPSHTCLCLLLCCPISSSLSRLGGAAGGRAVQCGVCARVTATRDHGLVLLTAKALSKKYHRKRLAEAHNSPRQRHAREHVSNVQRGGAISHGTTDGSRISHKTRSRRAGFRRFAVGVG